MRKTPIKPRISPDARAQERHRSQHTIAGLVFFEGFNKLPAAHNIELIVKPIQGLYSKQYTKLRT